MIQRMFETFFALIIAAVVSQTNEHWFFHSIQGVHIIVIWIREVFSYKTFFPFTKPFNALQHNWNSTEHTLSRVIYLWTRMQNKNIAKVDSRFLHDNFLTKVESRFLQDNFLVKVESRILQDNFLVKVDSRILQDNVLVKVLSRFYKTIFWPRLNLEIYRQFSGQVWM